MRYLNNFTIVNPYFCSHNFQTMRKCNIKKTEVYQILTSASVYYIQTKVNLQNIIVPLIMQYG